MRWRDDQGTRVALFVQQSCQSNAHEGFACAHFTIHDGARFALFQEQRGRGMHHVALRLKRLPEQSIEHRIPIRTISTQIDRRVLRLDLLEQAITKLPDEVVERNDLFSGLG